MAVGEQAVSDLARQHPARLRRWWESVSIIFESKVAVVGLTLVLFWIFVAIFAPFIAPMDPYTQDLTAHNRGPSLKHPLGTDHIGRDILSRIVYGSRVVLALAPLAVLVATIIGTILGLTAGYAGGLIDEAIMRLLDALLALPPILLYLVIMAALGPSAMNVVIAIIAWGSPGIARLVRSLTLDLKNREYVAAAKLRGESPLYITFVEILPNARGPVLVDAMLRVGYAVFAIATLGFLGLGLPPPTPDWGSMVSDARKWIWMNPLAALFPSLSITSLVVGLNLFADGLREALARYR